MDVNSVYGKLSQIFGGGREGKRERDIETERETRSRMHTHTHTQILHIYYNNKIVSVYTHNVCIHDTHLECTNAG
jgi:hypothetical protein